MQTLQVRRCSIAKLLQHTPKLSDQLGDAMRRNLDGNGDFVCGGEMQYRPGLVWRGSDPNLLDRYHVAVQAFCSFLRIPNGASA